MNNCLVTVVDPEEGVRVEWRGSASYARIITTGDEIPPEQGENWSNQEKTRKGRMWACEESQVPILLEHISKEWVGYELKVFKLSQVATRLAGDLREKQLSKDGILPT